MARIFLHLVRLGAVALALGLAGCGTPEAVKSLSQAQLDAFDAAVSSAEAQSAAIVALATKVRDYEVEKFDAARAAAQQQSVAALANVADR